MRIRSIARPAGRLLSAALWLGFPIVPLLAEDAYYGIATLDASPGSTGGPDPYEWDWVRCAVILGPLIGYGFLAGATWGIEDSSGRRWWAWWSRRSVWVGLGPWLGFGTVIAAWLAFSAAEWTRDAWGPAPAESPGPPWSPGPTLATAAVIAGCGWVSMGWMIVAWRALRRARAAGRLGSAWRRGLGLASAFLATLFGGYWALTTLWRDYFFDSAILP